MKQNLLTVLLLFFISFLRSQPNNQQVIASSGSYTNNGNISLSTTVGEPVILTLSVTSTKLTQGFQQPYYKITNNVTVNGNENLKVIIYPNPTYERIIIDLANDISEHAKLNVSDELGKVLFSQSLKFNELNTVNLTHLASGQYFFSITDTEGNILSTHKIQKIN